MSTPVKAANDTRSLPRAAHDREQEHAADPWGRVTVTVPARLPAWVPDDARRLAEAREEGVHVVRGDTGRGDVFLWIERTGGRTGVEVYQELPESEAFYDRIGVQDQDVRRRLVEASRTYNRDVRHLVLGHGLSPAQAKNEVGRIHAEVLALTVQAAAQLAGAAAGIGALGARPMVPAMTAAPRPALAREVATTWVSRDAAIGGKWTAIDPRQDPLAMAQRDRLSCGTACGQMLLKDRGVRVSQEEIASQAGGTPVSPAGLEHALNTLDPGGSGRWIGGLVRGARPASDPLRLLCEAGSWSGILWDRDGRIGHAVVIDGIDAANRVWVRDPWARGTRYSMTMEDFLAHWTGVAVHKRAP